jgi:hypothetical protein
VVKQIGKPLLTEFSLTSVVRSHLMAVCVRCIKWAAVLSLSLRLYVVSEEHAVQLWDLALEEVWAKRYCGNSFWYINYFRLTQQSTLN